MCCLSIKSSPSHHDSDFLATGPLEYTHVPLLSFKDLKKF